MKRKAMWTIDQLVDSNDMQVCINGKYVVSRPENYKPRMCSLLRRIGYAWQVIIGAAETFSWPEGQ
jgi:hypothetical protein